MRIAFQLRYVDGNFRTTLYGGGNSRNDDEGTDGGDGTDGNDRDPGRDGDEKDYETAREVTKGIATRTL